MRAVRATQPLVEGDEFVEVVVAGRPFGRVPSYVVEAALRAIAERHLRALLEDAVVRTRRLVLTDSQAVLLAAEIDASRGLRRDLRSRGQQSDALRDMLLG